MWKENIKRITQTKENKLIKYQTKRAEKSRKGRNKQAEFKEQNEATNLKRDKEITEMRN
jgi:hypothetical protein